MKLFAKILPIILILSLIAVGCKKPKGAKRVKCDLTFHLYNLTGGVPWCDSVPSYSPNSHMKWPYHSVISDIDTFNYYFGCVDTMFNGSSPSNPTSIDADFLDFNDHDLIILQVVHDDILMGSYKITNEKLYADKEENKIYLMYTEHYTGGGSSLTWVERLYFIEIPKGYEGYELGFVRKFRRAF